MVRRSFSPELAFARKGKPGELDFEVFIPAIILDRNSQVRFHKTHENAGSWKSQLCTISCTHAA